MRLTSIYRVRDHEMRLYEFMRRRLEEPSTNISHTHLPTIEEHAAFVRARPYYAWYFIEDEDGAIAGSLYMTKNRELGIYILPEHRGKGLGTAALAEIIRRWPGRFLAHINPNNAGSIRLFQRMGFGPQPLQVTYERKPPQ